VQAPSCRSSHASVTCADAMWVFGGMGERHILGDLYCLALDTLKWTRVMAGPQSQPSFDDGTTRHSDEAVCQPSIRYGATLVQNPWYASKFYLFGGRSYANTPDSGLYEFDTEAMRWNLIKTTGTQPQPRYGHAMVPLYLSSQQVKYDLWRNDNPEGGKVRGGGGATVASPSEGLVAWGLKHVARQGPVSVPKGAPHIPRPRRTSHIGLFASTATRTMAKPDPNAEFRKLAMASHLRRRNDRQEPNLHDPLVVARLEEDKKYKTVVVCGGVRIDGGGFCDPTAVFRLLCAPPPFKEEDDSSVRIDTFLLASIESTSSHRVVLYFPQSLKKHIMPASDSHLDVLGELSTAAAPLGMTSFDRSRDRRSPSEYSTSRHVARRASRRSQGVAASPNANARGHANSRESRALVGLSTSDAYAETLQLGLSPTSSRSRSQFPSSCVLDVCVWAGDGGTGCLDVVAASCLLAPDINISAP